MSDDIVLTMLLRGKSRGENAGKGDTLIIEPKRQMLANLNSWSKI